MTVILLIKDKIQQKKENQIKKIMNRRIPV